MQRITEIPAEVTLINPSYEVVNLAGFAQIDARPVAGHPVRGVIQLHKHPEVVRARLWQAIKNCVFGKVLIMENPTAAVDKEPVEGAENLQHLNSGPMKVENALRNPDLEVKEKFVQADFSVVQGITQILAQRIVSLGFKSYEQFLNTDEKVLLKIEGINRENLDVISAAMAMLIQIPDPETVQPPLPPVQISSEIDNSEELAIQRMQQ